MKSQKEFLKDIITALAQAGISYMVSGSISSTFYGQPRSTQDVDIIIEATLENLQELVSILQNKDYYADEEAALGVAIVRGDARLGIHANLGQNTGPEQVLPKTDRRELEIPLIRPVSLSEIYCITHFVSQTRSNGIRRREKPQPVSSRSLKMHLKGGTNTLSVFSDLR